MYLFKEELKDEITSKFKIRYLANEIGIHEVQLYRILNNKSKTSKPVAYLFTKLINKEAEIEDYFVNVKEVWAWKIIKKVLFYIILFMNQ